MMKTKGSADDDDYDDGEDDEFGVSDYGDNMEDDEGHDLDGNEQDVEGKRAISHQVIQWILFTTILLVPKYFYVKTELAILSYSHFEQKSHSMHIKIGL